MFTVQHGSSSRRGKTCCSSLVVALLFLPVGCNAPSTSPSIASNTNWLTACARDSDCGGTLSCNCGACTSRCNSTDDCRNFSGTQCIAGTEDAATALCGTTSHWSAEGVCLPRCTPGACAEGQFCALGICVPLALPPSQFCAADAQNNERRTDEELLAAAVEQARSSGGLNCGNGTVAAALPLLRLEPRLTCAARVLARDMATTENHRLVDSAGRGTEDRLTLVGYRQRLWAEGFAWDVSSADAALQLMLKGGDFCSGFSNEALADLGIGVYGDVFVVTLGVE